MKTNKVSHRQFWALLKNTPGYNPEYKEQIKESWVRAYSQGATGSLSSLYETNEKGYRQMLRDMAGRPAAAGVQDDRANRQRRKLLRLIYALCENRGYGCDSKKAVAVACTACGVKRLNDASEQKVIAAIKKIDNDCMDIAIKGLIECSK